MPSGEKHGNWNGGFMKTGAASQYVAKLTPEHPRSGKRGYVLLHVLIAEEALGKYLPPKAVVHHVDGNPGNNTNSNLVVCQDNNYHKLIEQRTKAYRVCGHVKWLKCQYCKQYDDPQNLYKPPGYSGQFHKECKKEYKREYDAKTRNSR